MAVVGHVSSIQPPLPALKRPPSGGRPRAPTARALARTGPATLTQREQVAITASVVGRHLAVEQIDPTTARAEYAAVMGEAFADQALGYWASLVEAPEPVAPGVDEALGRPPRPFEDWVRLHASDFA